MTRHRASEAGKERRVRGQKVRLFVPPPADWEYGNDGRPTWIRDRGSWAVVVDHPLIRVELPQGLPKKPRSEASFGSPPLEERNPKKLLYAAWLKDCGGDTYREVARRLRFRIDDLAGSEHAATKKARRYVKRGRALASARGIWPWASWPKGTPPRGAWWEDDSCRDWLLHRRIEAVQRAALAPALEAAELTRRLKRELLRIRNR